MLSDAVAPPESGTGTGTGLPSHPRDSTQGSDGTHGSDGFDVHTAAAVVLDSSGIYKVPLDAYGPLAQGSSAMLMLPIKES